MPLTRGALTARLRAAGCVWAAEEAAVLLAEVAPTELERAVERRERGEPLEQVVGVAEFAGMRLTVGPEVFVPRPRTEALVELALSGPAPAVAVDLCCGCGAVAAALAAAWPETEVHAADVDPAATALARVNLPARTDVHTGDLYDAIPAELRGRVGLVCANVPYVPTGELALLPGEAREHEPAVALDGGADGLDVARRVVAEAPAWLEPGGRLLIETSTGAQAGIAAEAFASAGLVPAVTESVELDVAVIAGTWNA